MATERLGHLSEHDVTLTGERVRLRPLTEDDWHVLLHWNNDRGRRMFEPMGFERCGG